MMSHEHESHNEPRPGTPDEQTIRLAADGELSPDEAARIQALANDDSTLASRLEHERRLREAVGRAIREDVRTPPGLRDRIARAMSQITDEQIESPADAPAETPAKADAPTDPDTHVLRPKTDTRRRDFWNRLPAALAVAATIALIASVLVVSISMSRPLYTDEDFGTRVVSFIEQEHDACAAFEERFERKFTVHSLEEARSVAREQLGGAVHALTIDPQTWADASLEFMGYGPCTVPGAERSGHMILRHQQSPAVVVSLFVHPDDGRLNFASSNCCYVNEGDAAGGESVVVWRRDGFVYYLYSPDPEAMSSARSILDTPENERELF